MKQNQIFLFEKSQIWMLMVNDDYEPYGTVINDYDEEWYWNNGDVLYVAQCQKSNNKCSFQISGG